MRIPQVFIPDNAELNLEKILAKKIYYIPKDWMSIEVRTVDGSFIASKTLDDSKITDEELIHAKNLDERVTDLNLFKFNGKDMFVAKFGDSMLNLVVFNDNLEELLFTQSYPNPSYCVFERKKDVDVLVMNTTGTKTRGTRMSCYNNKGKEVGSFNATMDNDTFTSATSTVKTGKQNYLLLNYFSHLAVVDESLSIVRSFVTPHQSSQKASVANIGGRERILVLGLQDRRQGWYNYYYTQTLNIFDNNFNLVEELDAEKFGCKSIFRFESFELNGKEHLLLAYKNKNDYADLKILSTGFEEVFSVKDVTDCWHIRVGKFNSQEYIFVPSKEKIRVYDENFKLKDKVNIDNCALKNRYSIVNINGLNYFTCIQEGILNFYSGDFPLRGSFFKKKNPVSIQLRNDPNNMWTYNLKRIIPFKHKDEDFLALEYWHNRCTDVYDSKFKFVRSFPGGDFCIA